MQKRGRLFKSVVSVVLALCMVVPLSAAAFAGTEGASDKCTSFYLGKDITRNGAYIWGRSEDYSPEFVKLFTVTEAQTHTPGDIYKSSVSGFCWPYPVETFRYTTCMESQFNDDYIGPEPYAEAGLNEKGVAISATVTLSGPLEAIEEVDPFVENGIGEGDIPSIVLMQSTSARGACELIAEVIDEVGAEWTEGFMISDPKEVWFFQILAGHQYAAVKCPDDMVGFSPNLTANMDLSDTENVIVSEYLTVVAELAETLVKDEGGNIKIADSYAVPVDPERLTRMWLGYNYLNNAKAADAVAERLGAGDEYIDFFIEPREQNVSIGYTLYEALRLLAYRGEGTKMDVDGAVPPSDVRAIGADRNLETHVFEVRQNMPDALATVEWLCMGPPEFGVYIPYYASLITKTYEKYYEPDAAEYNSKDPNANLMYHVNRELFNASIGDGSRADRTKYGKGVQDFWRRYQWSLIEQQALVDAKMAELYEADPEQAQALADELSLGVAKEVYEYAQLMLKELNAFKAAGAEGNFVPSILEDTNAIPHYAQLETAAE